MCRGREREVSMTMKKKVGIMMLAACLLVTVLANIASARVHYDEGEGIATYAVVPAEEILHAAGHHAPAGWRRSLRKRTEQLHDGWRGCFGTAVFRQALRLRGGLTTEIALAAEWSLLRAGLICTAARRPLHNGRWLVVGRRRPLEISKGVFRGRLLLCCAIFGCAGRRRGVVDWFCCKSA